MIANPTQTHANYIPTKPSIIHQMSNEGKKSIHNKEKQKQANRKAINKMLTSLLNKEKLMYNLQVFIAEIQKQTVDTY